jgi:putative membrane protein
MAAKLNKLEGEAFDREYMKQAGVGDHTKVHSMLKKDSARAKDPDVKALAAKMMPTVEQHLTQAKGMPMAKKGGGMADAKGTKAPVTGEANDHTSPGTSASTPTGEANDHTSAGAVRPAPTAKDTKPQPAPAIKQ